MNKKKWILCLCYGIAALVFLLMTVGAWLADRVSAASGRLTAETLTAEDLTLTDLRRNADGTLTVTGGDPQLLYRVPEGRSVRGVQLRLSAPVRGECSLYYLKDGQTDFSGRQTVLSAYGEEQDFTYLLPCFVRCTALRLDTGCTVGDTFAVEQLRLNASLPLSAYLSVGPRTAAVFLFCPLLAACAVITAAELLCVPKKTEKED